MYTQKAEETNQTNFSKNGEKLVLVLLAAFYSCGNFVCACLNSKDL